MRIAPHHLVMLASALVAAAVGAPLVHAASATGLVCRSCVDSSDIRNSTITTSDVKNSTINASDVKDNSLLANDIGPSAIGASELADASVGSGEIIDGTVGGADIADGTITAADIASGVLSSGALASGSVGSAELADGSVSTGDLAFDPVTEAEFETGIEGFNASRSAWMDITPLSIEDATLTPMFGLSLFNRDGNDDEIVVTRDTRLLVSGSITIQATGTSENVACAPQLDSAAYAPAQIGSASWVSVAPGQYATLPISGSATVAAGTYDVHVACMVETETGDGVITIDGYVNAWLAEQ